MTHAQIHVIETDNYWIYYWKIVEAKQLKLKLTSQLIIHMRILKFDEVIYAAKLLR